MDRQFVDSLFLAESFLLVRTIMLLIRKGATAKSKRWYLVFSGTVPIHFLLFKNITFVFNLI